MQRLLLEGMGFFPVRIHARLLMMMKMMMTGSEAEGFDDDDMVHDARSKVEGCQARPTDSYPYPTGPPSRDQNTPSSL